VVMVFNSTFDTISVISRWSVLLVEEIGENHRSAATHRKTYLVHIAMSVMHCIWLWCLTVLLTIF
jgi:hypothetical protein